MGFGLNGRHTCKNIGKYWDYLPILAFTWLAKVYRLRQSGVCCPGLAAHGAKRKNAKLSNCYQSMGFGAKCSI
jgi:hypothetical protein